MPDPIIIEPPTEANASIIWLHGLGASADDFAGLANELQLGAVHGLRLILPNAPTRPVTVNNGIAIPAWYDIGGMDSSATEDANGLEASRKTINSLVANERALGIASKRIMIGGFSQGGALALHVGLRYAEPLAGIVALSAYLPLHDRLQNEATPANRLTPIFMAHGNADPVVAPELGAGSRDYLIGHGYDVAWRTYAMEHEVVAPELTAVHDWMAAIGLI